MGVESHSISSKLLKSTSGTYRIVKSWFVAPFCWVQVGPQVDISLVSPYNYIILFFLRLKLFTSVGEMNSSRWQRFHEIPLMKFLKKQEGPFALINPMLCPQWRTYRNQVLCYWTSFPGRAESFCVYMSWVLSSLEPMALLVSLQLNQALVSARKLSDEILLARSFFPLCCGWHVTQQTSGIGTP